GPPRHRARGAGADGSKQSGPRILGPRDRSGALFGQRLPQMLRRQSDFLPELDQLLFSELVGLAGVARCSLQLRCPREHALERSSIEPGTGVSDGRTRVGHIEYYGYVEGV